MYAGWKDLRDGCWVTEYNPGVTPMAIKPTVKGYELLEQLDIGWFRICEVPGTLDDAMKAASRVRRFR